MSNRRNDIAGGVGPSCYACSQNCGNHDAISMAKKKVEMACKLIQEGGRAGLDIDLEGFLSGTIKMLLDKAQKDLEFFEHS